MPVDAQRSQRALKQARRTQDLPPELAAGESLLQLLSEMAVEIIENVRASAARQTLLDNTLPDRAKGSGVDENGTWDQIVLAAWSAYASGLFGRRDIDVAVNAAMAPRGIRVLPKHARDALDDLDAAERVVPAHLRERVLALMKQRAVETNRRVGDARGTARRPQGEAA